MNGKWPDFVVKSELFKVFHGIVRGKKAKPYLFQNSFKQILISHACLSTQAYTACGMVQYKTLRVQFAKDGKVIKRCLGTSSQ